MTPRDGGGTQNRQKSANMTAVKKENANICKIDFPVLCTFTLFNADFCTFLQSLRSEQGMNLLCSLVMLIVISIAFLRTVFDDKVSLSEDKRFSLGYGYLIWV